MKIAIQKGLERVEGILREKGFETVLYGEEDRPVGITIINGVDDVYEEIDPVTFYGGKTTGMVLLNASRLSEEEILKYVEKYSDKPKKIALQHGMERTREKLIELGYDVVPADESFPGVRVSIIRSGDAAYEEIEPVSFYGTGDNEMVVLDASQLSPEELVKYVEKYASL